MINIFSQRHVAFCFVSVRFLRVMHRPLILISSYMCSGLLPRLAQIRRTNAFTFSIFLAIKFKTSGTSFRYSLYIRISSISSFICILFVTNSNYPRLKNFLLAPVIIFIHFIQRTLFLTSYRAEYIP
jgi:hypothetical protein